MAHKLEVGISEVVGDVCLSPREVVIEANDIIPLRQQTINEMGS